MRAQLVFLCSAATTILIISGCGDDVLEPPASQLSVVEQASRYPQRPSRAFPCGPRERVAVSDLDGLLSNIGRDGIDLVLASGHYVVPACPEGTDEWSDALCGQLEQGDCSVLRSDLTLRLGAHRVPLGGGPVVSDCPAIPTGRPGDGAVIDCGALPASGLEFSCLVAGNHGVIADTTVCNGTPPVPLGPGELGTHRNAIIVIAGQEATVEGVRVVNARRGVLFTTESDQVTRGVVRQSLIEGTELAGVFFWSRPPDDAAEFRVSNNAQMLVELESTRITRAGLHPILVVWAYFGAGNYTRARLVNNVVDAPSVFGITVQGVGTGVMDNRAWFEVRGGSLSGGRGVYVANLAADSANNTLVGSVREVEIASGEPALGFEVHGANTRVDVVLTDNRYSGPAKAGQVGVLIDEGNTLRVRGPMRMLERRNRNFDFAELAPYVTE